MMSITAVKSYFKELGLEDRVLEFSVSSATVALAAQAVGCEEARIAKTLSFLVDGHAVLIVTAGMPKSTIENSRISSIPKQRCSLPRSLPLWWDMAPGGVCPFAVPHT